MLKNDENSEILLIIFDLQHTYWGVDTRNGSLGHHNNCNDAMYVVKTPTALYKFAQLIES